MKQTITLVMAGDISSKLPKGLDKQRDIAYLKCELRSKSISDVVSTLGDNDYVLLLPATSRGIKMCEVVRAKHSKVPIVLVGESEDKELLLYSTHLGCLDFISDKDDAAIVKKSLEVYLKLYSMYKKLKSAGEKI